jgi:hypothetical protein
VVGSDYTQDEARNTLFNGSPSRFDATYLGDQQVLGLVSSPSSAIWGNPDNYYQTIFFPKPIVGKWEVRNSHVIDVRRIPSQAAGYCYGKKIIYLDPEVYLPLWEDMFDSNMRLWKIGTVAYFPSEVPNEGMQATTGNIWSDMIDLSASHLSCYITSDAQGRNVKDNQDCSNYEGQDFTDYHRFATVAGLSEVMR